MTVRFTYEPTADFGQPLKKRLGNYPRVPDMTWDFLRWLGRWAAVAFVRAQFRLTVTGTVPTDERVALVANHASHLDAVAILAALPPDWRAQVCVLAAEDYFFTHTPKALAASLLCQGVAFDRMHWTTIRSWYTHFKHLARGRVLFFPSGSRKARTLQPGLPRMLLKAGWTILPVRLSGMGQAWPVGARLWRPMTAITVAFQTPYRQGDVRDLQDLMHKLERDLYDEPAA